MKDFRQRTIAETSTDGRILVSKTRKSNGYGEIFIDANGRLLKFCSTDDSHEAEVNTLLQLLIKIVNHPCLLEEEEED